MTKKKINENKIDKKRIDGNKAGEKKPDENKIKEKRKSIFKKGDMITLRIEDLTEEGEGVGRIDGYTIFVHNALPGDYLITKLIKVKSNYAIGIIHQMHEKSSDRVKAECKYAAKCGGCQLQDYAYEAQVKFKENTIKNALKRIGGLDLDNIGWSGFRAMDEPFYYRNKGIYQLSPVESNKVNKKGEKHGSNIDVSKDSENNFEMGFYRKRSHELIDVEHCMLQSKPANEIMEKLREAIKVSGLSIYDELDGKGSLRRIMIRTTSSDPVEAMLVVVSTEISSELMKFARGLAEIDSRIQSIYINLNSDPGNTALSDKYDHVYGKANLLDYIGEATFKLSPQSFFQVNTVQTEVLYNEVVKSVEDIVELSDAKSISVLDLYCGIGSIGIYLAKKISSINSIIGIEIVESAIEDAMENAALNNLYNTEYKAGKAEDLIIELSKRSELPDVVILDPPRKGCDEALLETLADMNVQNIVYVSCKPSTLARDVAYLSKRGYVVKRSVGVDMFCMTGHVETVVLLSHKKSQASSPSL